ncbi:hypothetical protein AVEN_332-1 [Araneus ventricosus]|uniref:Uncharacterized protein n=1 Tax=Araneus ventricosus TaxID=182803 RepID=A0A4Y2I006_ARAVE|nr:hypothetical protein AVEN_332-1 [Araneus ventricosus]
MSCVAWRLGEPQIDNNTQNTAYIVIGKPRPERSHSGGQKVENSIKVSAELCLCVNAPRLATVAVQEVMRQIRDESENILPKVDGGNETVICRQTQMQ